MFPAYVDTYIDEWMDRSPPIGTDSRPKRTISKRTAISRRTPISLQEVLLYVRPPTPPPPPPLYIFQKHLHHGQIVMPRRLETFCYQDAQLTKLTNFSSACANLTTNILASIQLQLAYWWRLTEGDSKAESHLQRRDRGVDPASRH